MREKLSLNIDFFISQFSTKKLAGTVPDFKFNGCTTDSGGGGTGSSLYSHMNDLNLCADNYLIGYCCLHTMQLTLSNALNLTIGKGGLDNRNALQAIHTFYDLQEAMEFGLWKKEWARAASQTGKGGLKVKKMAAPILTRWWTVGEASRSIVEYLPIFIQIARNMINYHKADSKLNKIASSLVSLISEPIIVSDIKLIKCFHGIFIDDHFNWLQKGDRDIGGTPGFLGRHMLLRYYLMHSDLHQLINDGWKKCKGMEVFVNSLSENSMKGSIEDPTDPKKERMIECHEVQSKKANSFFQIAFTILKKHYNIFCEDLLFLSLYGEPCSTQTVARILQGCADDNNIKKKVNSIVHGRSIDVINFATFVKNRVNIQEQMKSAHIQTLMNDLPYLIGKLVKLVHLLSDWFTKSPYHLYLLF